MGAGSSIDSFYCSYFSSFMSEILFSTTKRVEQIRVFFSSHINLTVFVVSKCDHSHLQRLNVQLHWSLARIFSLWNCMYKIRNMLSMWCRPTVHKLLYSFHIYFNLCFEQKWMKTVYVRTYTYRRMRMERKLFLFRIQLLSVHTTYIFCCSIYLTCNWD